MTDKDDYFKPLRPYIILTDHTNTLLLYEYDAFNPPLPGTGAATVDYAQVTIRQNEAGNFRLRIVDNERTLDRTKIGMGNRFYIFGSKLEGSQVFPLMYGFIRTDQIIREGFDQYAFEMTGFSTQIVFNERIINFAAQAPPDPNDPTKLDMSSGFWQAWNLFTVLNTQKHVDPLGVLPLKDTHYPDMLQATAAPFISTDVNTKIGSLNFPYVEARQALDTITDTVGAIWGTFPYTNEYIYLQYPRFAHSGIVIKDTALESDFAPNRMFSFCRSGFTMEHSIRIEDGFANRIFSNTAEKRTVTKATGTPEDFTRLGGLDIAQQFKVDATKLRNMAVLLTFKQKEYEINGNEQPLWEPRPLQFAIVNDDNNRPGRIVLARSWFDLNLEPNTPTRVNLVFPASMRLWSGAVGQKAWLILFENALWRLNIKGGEDRLNVDIDNCLFWHHNPPTSTGGTAAWRTVDFAQTLTRRDPPMTDMTSGWNVNVDYITYDHIFIDDFSHTIECSDPDSIDKYGPIETFVDMPFITDVGTLGQYLTSIIEWSALPRTMIRMGRATIPNNTIFHPAFGLVTIVDTKSGTVAPNYYHAEIQEVTYTFDAHGGQPLGCTDVDLQPIGFYDFRRELII